ncbi:hypothetical protein ACYSNO_08995 [Enterococcus sp. LJL98]
MLPSYMTIQYHERDRNHFGTTLKEQVLSFTFAILFSLILFKLVAYSMTATFLFLGLHLLLLYFIIWAYPAYQLNYEEAPPTYSNIETFFLFIVGFFTIFIFKSEKKIGMATFLPLFFVLLCLFMLLFLFYLKNTHLKRQFNPIATLLMIYKGMLTNFIFVFCTLYQLLRHGSLALYLVYSLYLTAVILAPLVLGRIPSVHGKRYRLFYGFLVSFALLLTNRLFYLGVFSLSLCTAIYNQKINRAVYHYQPLPQDLRLVAKYRLGNIGNILHQLLMMATLALLARNFEGITVSRIMNDYAFKIQDKEVLVMMFFVKTLLIIIFVLLLLFLQKKEKKLNFSIPPVHKKATK